MDYPITFPRVEGRTSRQAHVDLPTETYEREVGREGFHGASTHIYHAHPPTGWSDWEGPIRPRAFDTASINEASASPWNAVRLLSNDHVDYRLWRVDGPMDHLVRNGDGDELLFIHEGAGDLYCDFGHLSYRDGDYIVLPRGTMWRIETTAPTKMLMIEATDDAYRLPDKGIAGDHAIFDPAMLDVPAINDQFTAQQGEGDWQLQLKRRNVLSAIRYPFNPLDAVGWKGTLLPVRINWRDMRPLMSHRYHLPPSVHTTFLANRFVICTFVPRPLESDAGALRVPFFHSNADYDEVIFYHAGDFFSRDNIHPGMISLHPAGFPHGPHPKAFAAGASQAKTETDEVAVMVDTRDALDVAAGAEAIEWSGYVNSWRPGEAD